LSFPLLQCHFHTFLCIPYKGFRLKAFSQFPSRTELFFSIYLMLAQLYMIARYKITHKAVQFILAIIIVHLHLAESQKFFNVIISDLFIFEIFFSLFSYSLIIYSLISISTFIFSISTFMSINSIINLLKFTFNFVNFTLLNS